MNIPQDDIRLIRAEFAQDIDFIIDATLERNSIVGRLDDTEYSEIVAGRAEPLSFLYSQFSHKYGSEAIDVGAVVVDSKTFMPEFSMSLEPRRLFPHLRRNKHVERAQIMTHPKLPNGFSGSNYDLRDRKAVSKALTDYTLMPRGEAGGLPLHRLHVHYGNFYEHRQRVLVAGQEQWTFMPVDGFTPDMVEENLADFRVNQPFFQTLFVAVREQYRQAVFEVFMDKPESVSDYVVGRHYHNPKRIDLEASFNPTAYQP